MKQRKIRVSGIKRVAVFDIGTNSILGCIADIENNKLKIIKELNTIVKLGENSLNKNLLSEEKIKLTEKTLCRYKKISEKYGVKEIIAAGTMILRKVKNSNTLINRIKTKCGLDIKILSGEEEAILSYKGIQTSISHRGYITIIDIGGGSTEIITGKGESIKKVYSLDIGIISITEKFSLSNSIKEENLKKADNYIKQHLNKIEVMKNGALIGTGGTITNFAAVKHKMEKYDSEIINKTVLTKKEIDDIFNFLKKQPLQNRKDIKGLEPERADTIIAGGIILLNLMEHFKKEKLLVSDGGLRHGLIYEYFINNKKGEHYV